MADLTSSLKGLILSANELKSMTGWPTALVEDYLSLLENIIEIAGQVDLDADTITAIEKRLNLIAEVVDIDNPTELGDLAGDLNGTMLIAIQSGVYTLYEFSTTSLTANSPYVISGSSGSWTAVGGKYTNDELNVGGALNVVGATNASTLNASGISTFTGKGTFQNDLDVTLNADVGGTLDVTGDTTVETLQVNDISTFEEKGTFNKNLTVNGATNLNATSALSVSASTLLMQSKATFKNIIALDTPISEPATPTTGAVKYIDIADGDYKIKFSNGTVRTIASD